MTEISEANVNVNQKADDHDHEHDHEHEHEHEHFHDHRAHDHSRRHRHSHGHSHEHDHHHEHHHGHTHAGEGMVTDRPGKINEYDLLEERKKRNETDDPEVEEYFKAKELFTKGFELASKIPDNSEEETLKKYEREIFESTQYLVEAFLLDDKATEMSSRIMSLAQQYEKLLKLGEDSEKKEIEEKVVEIKDEEISEQKKIKDPHSSAEEADASEPEFTRESLILVIWLLFNGKQYKFCIQTLTVALNQLEPTLYPRLLHLRASCHLAIGDHKSCVKDLERLTSIKSDFVSAYNILGSIHMSQGDRLDAARNFKIYIEKANKDSLSYSHALYSLCALTIQNATSATTGNRLRIQQAFNYYQKAKEAEIRYENLYGQKPDMTDVKRTSDAFFEQKSQKETTTTTTNTNTNNNNKVEKDSKKEAERLAPILQQLFKKCNNCNSLSRKNENGEVNNEKLLICAGCRQVNYCSKECQKKDWKKHKQQCAYLKEMTKNK